MQLRERFLGHIVFGAVGLFVGVIMKGLDTNLMSTVYKTTQISSLEGKLGLMASFLLLLGVFTIVSVFFVIGARLFEDKVDTLKEQQSDTVRLGNLIIFNTLEQGAVFVGIYLYWLVDQKNNNQLRNAMLFPTLFLIGRVMFALANIIGFRMKMPNMMSFGYVFNLISILQVIAEIYELPFLNRHLK